MWQQYLTAIAIAWSLILLVVIGIGVTQLYRHLSIPIPEPISLSLSLSTIPHVTVIRPIVGLEPYLEACLESTFTQDYPSSKLTISFCVASPIDPALPILKNLLARYPSYDAHIYIESEDPNLSSQDGGQEHNLGPNPKIRNMSRAYREAKGDVVWIADCNVWLHERTAGLMVDLLCGFKKGSKKYKFVHQLPLAVDVSHLPPSKETLLSGRKATGFGGLLEELFMSTAHVKFYTAISTVAIAPCTVGKSNMFRRSHLNALTQPKANEHGRSAGIDFFSDNICEDHLIGDLLWKTPVPDSVLADAVHEGQSQDSSVTARSSTQSWRHHALLLNPPCIQPQFNTLASTYSARRIRWLRVRKFTVPVATLVEPATESLVACTLMAWAFTSNTWIHTNIGIPQTWPVATAIWLSTMSAWAFTDFCVWTLLQSWSGNAQDERAAPPIFVGAAQMRSWQSWFRGWLGREILAFPVWAWAVLGGTKVVWRGRQFWVGVDMKVHEIGGVSDGKGMNGKKMK